MNDKGSVVMGRCGRTSYIHELRRRLIWRVNATCSRLYNLALMRPTLEKGYRSVMVFRGDGDEAKQDLIGSAGAAAFNNQPSFQEHPQGSPLRAHPPPIFQDPYLTEYNEGLQAMTGTSGRSPAQIGAQERQEPQAKLPEHANAGVRPSGEGRLSYEGRPSGEGMRSASMSHRGSQAFPCDGDEGEEECACCSRRAAMAEEWRLEKAERDRIRQWAIMERRRLEKCFNPRSEIFDRKPFGSSARRRDICRDVYESAQEACVYKSSNQYLISDAFSPEQTLQRVLEAQRPTRLQESGPQSGYTPHRPEGAQRSQSETRNCQIAYKRPFVPCTLHDVLKSKRSVSQMMLAQALCHDKAKLIEGSRSEPLKTRRIFIDPELNTWSPLARSETGDYVCPSLRTDSGTEAGLEGDGELRKSRVFQKEAGHSRYLAAETASVLAGNSSADLDYDDFIYLKYLDSSSPRVARRLRRAQRRNVVHPFAPVSVAQRLRQHVQSAQSLLKSANEQFANTTSNLLKIANRPFRGLKEPLHKGNDEETEASRAE